MIRDSLPPGWTRLTVNDIREDGDYTLVGGPFGSDLTQKDYVDNTGIPVIRGTNLGGTESRFVDDGFVFVSERKAALLARNTAIPGDVVFTQRGTLGQVAVVPDDARFPKYIISQSQMKLTPDRNRVDARFLYQYFRAPQTVSLLLRQTQATGVPHINLGILKRFPVLLPPLPEQKRIAGVLDRAEALRAKRRDALAQLDALTQAIFLDMFGDPVTNPKGWEAFSVGEVADVQGGLQVTSARAKNPIEVPYLRVANVYRGFLDLTEVKQMRVTAAESLRTALMKHDLLVVEGHGNPSEIGRCALWDGSVPGCVHQNHIIRARFNLVRVDPVYAADYLNSPGGRRHLLRAGKTTSGLNTISVSDVRETPITLPPLPLQQEFARRVAAVEQLRAAQRQSLSKLDELFASLQHRAFRGEL